MTTAVESLCEMGRFREAEHLVQELVKIEGGLSDAPQRVKILTCAATVAAGLGEVVTAVDYHPLGKSAEEGIEEQYWRKHAAEDLGLVCGPVGNA